MTTPQGSPVIGVFDSGVGGLTVLRALRKRLPHAHYLYVGDTARLPYGSKSQATVVRYAVESARFLLAAGAQSLVIACNTASALALPELRAAAAPIPVLGVIEAGAEAARAATHTGDVVVLATSATVASHAYARACAARGLRALEKACPLLVPLVEEGWLEHPVTREVLRIYLEEARHGAAEAGMRPDALVLGCTHYPLLRAELAALAPRNFAMIDSAEVTADEIVRMLAARGPAPVAPLSGPMPPVRFFATDGVERFRALGSRFLGEEIGEVTLIDLGG